MRQKSLPLCLALAAWLLAGPALPAKSDPDTRGTLPSGLELVPLDASGFLTFQAGELLRSPAGKEFRAKLAETVPDFPNKFHEHVGVALGQIERVTFIFPPTSHQPPTTVITTAKPFDRDAVRKAILPRGEEKQLVGKTVYSGPGERAQVLYFPSDRVFVVGFTQSIEPILKHKPRPEAKGPLSKALALAAGSYPLVASFNLGHPLYQEAAKDLKREGVIQVLIPLLKVQKGELTIVTDAATRGTMRLTYAEESDAKEAREAVEKARKLFLGSISKVKTQVKNELKLPRKDPLGKYILKKSLSVLDQVKEGLMEATVKAPNARELVVSMKLKTNSADLVTVMGGFFMASAPSETAQPDLPPKAAKP